MLNKTVVKYIQSLSQKKRRDEAGEFIAEGPKLVSDLMESDDTAIKHIYATADWIEKNKNIAGENDLIEITDTDLERISQLTTPNKVLAVVKQFAAPKKIDTKDKIVLALENIQDPGNMGTILRTADWFGVGQVVCSTDCADLYNPKVVQATMGSIARVKVLMTDLEKWLAAQKDIRIYATTLDGQDITSLKKIKEGIIIIGNESKGISEEILKLADVKITIPKKGKAESLNAAVAAGVVLSYCTT